MSKPKRTMARHEQEYVNNGPSFLYYLMHNYAGAAQLIVRSTISKLDKLGDKMQFGFKWNVDEFTTYVSALLITLTGNGSKYSMILDKVYKVLTHSPCLLFNSEIIMYKQVHFTSRNVQKLLIKASEEYKSLVTTHQ